MWDIEVGIGFGSGIIGGVMKENVAS